MNIPKLTKQQLYYSIVILLFIVILMFVVRDFQAQRYINNQVEVCEHNLDWLADRCGCDLEQEIADYKQEVIANKNWDVNKMFTFPA